MRPTSSLAASCAFVTLAVAALAQNPAPKIPRGSDGKPDLTGVWQGGSSRIGTWEEANGGGGTNATTGQITPFAVRTPQEKAPYQPWAAEKVLESFNRRGIDDPMARCLAPGVPRTTTMGLFPMQIVQTPSTVVMLFEVFHVFRVIPIGVKHPDDLEPSFMGDSIGRWDGDTLVVDAIGFNDKTWLAGTGTFHSDKLHVVEKFTRKDENTIAYEVTMEDPTVLTKPWTVQSTMMLRRGTRLREYECVENNTDLERYEKLLKDESVFRRK
jgi:hypothetical protein